MATVTADRFWQVPRVMSCVPPGFADHGTQVAPRVELPAHAVPPPRRRARPRLPPPNRGRSHSWLGPGPYAWPSEQPRPRRDGRRRHRAHRGPDRWGPPRAPGPRSLPGFLSDTHRTTYETLHTAALAARHTSDPVCRARAQARPPATCARCSALRPRLHPLSYAVTWDGIGRHHAATVATDAAKTLRDRRDRVLDHGDITCDGPNCAIRAAVVAPIVTDGRIVGALAAYAPGDGGPGPRRHRGRRLGLDPGRTRRTFGRERARAQRPNWPPSALRSARTFIYNSLGAIASFVPHRPRPRRELLLEFADFTRYALRRGGRSRRSPTNCVMSSVISSSSRRASVIGCTSTCSSPRVLAVSLPISRFSPGRERRPPRPRGQGGHRNRHAHRLRPGRRSRDRRRDDGVGADPTGSGRSSTGPRRANPMGSATSTRVCGLSMATIAASSSRPLPAPGLGVPSESPSSRRTPCPDPPLSCAGMSGESGPGLTALVVRRRGTGAFQSCAISSIETSGSAPSTSPPPAPTRCASSTPSPSTSSSPTSRCRPRRDGLARILGRFAQRPAVVSSPLTTTTPSTPSPSDAVDYVMKPSGLSDWPRPSGAAAIVAAIARSRPTRPGRDDSRRTRRRHPLRQPRRHPLRHRPRGLCPVAHARRCAPGPGIPGLAGRALGPGWFRPHPSQHPRRHAPCDRGADGPRQVHGRRRRHRNRGQPAASA